MRIRLPGFIFGLACSVLVQSFAFAQGPNVQGYPGGPPNVNGCQLVRAIWGAGNRSADVTQIVQSMAQGNQLNFKVNNTNLGGDPAPDQKKTLRLTCQDWRGHANTHHYREGDYVNMQVVSPGYYQGLRVLSASWGYGNQTWNVTDRVNSMVNGNRLSFKVNTTNLGGDPAQGHYKQLAMSWIYSGRQGRRVWKEGDYVNLP